MPMMDAALSLSPIFRFPADALSRYFGRPRSSIHDQVISLITDTKGG
jgi:hypothetical protein